MIPIVAVCFSMILIERNSIKVLSLLQNIINSFESQDLIASLYLFTFDFCSLFHFFSLCVHNYFLFNH